MASVDGEAEASGAAHTDLRLITAPDDDKNRRSVDDLLLQIRPDLSAAIPVWPWQRRALVASVAVLFVALVLSPRETAVAVTLALAIPFLAVVLLRFIAAVALAFVPPAMAGTETGTCRRDEDLPPYAVLVPLYDEAEIVDGLVDALTELDYPVDKLAVRFVVEECDAKTRAAFARRNLPSHMSVLLAPPGLPRTKPRALNYALGATPGDYVVVYDAEDIPEPDQLRRAIVLFDKNPPELACLQARLNTFNPDESWLARQFTLEYTALFDAMLPALERFGLPVPLGGTSNHFRRVALQAALGWDPHNVTEDADLGIRLARFGMKVGVLDSTTWEEAPPTWRIWLGQRTRWLKGWIQTFLVHMREPRRLARELGWWPFFGFQLLMGSMIASALVHPWFYVLLAADLWVGSAFWRPEGEAALWLWRLAIANLMLGYITTILIGAVAILRRGRARLLPHLLLVPVYWLLISFAAYRALREIIVAPHHWEKTQHRARRRVVTTMP